MLIGSIKKPFPEFKWRWASYEPSEGLNDPRVCLGVLRALKENSGRSPTSPEVNKALKKIEEDLGGYLPKTLRLARDEDRNLLRNSQQYWSNVGLLETTKPAIKLTPFGNAVAEGRITKDEFAATIVRTFTLPNKRIEASSVISVWEAAKIELKPLALLLSIILQLGRSGVEYAYLTNEELTKVVVPLSSVGADVAQHAEHILKFRSTPTFFNSYEDFTPEANDRRITREFLLFLAHYGYLTISNPREKNIRQRFSADSKALAAIEALLELPISNWDVQSVVKTITSDVALSETMREKRTVSVTSRPGQQKFRRDVLKKSGGKCLLTGETFADVLRACHIIPVELKGSDDVGNGLCLREDLHILFDLGHLRIDEDGHIYLSDAAKSSVTYQELPASVALPSYINRKCLAHRWTYLS